MNRANGVLRLLAGAAMMILIVAASRVSWEWSPPSASELRLSWRYVSPTVAACRAPTEEELSGLPQHMRPSEVCDGGAIPFNLRVMLDGRTLREGPVAGNGERAFSIYERFDVSPGSHELAVDFWPDTTTAELPDGLAQRLVQSVAFEERRAVLLTLGDAGLEFRTQAR